MPNLHPEQVIKIAGFNPGHGGLCAQAPGEPPEWYCCGQRLNGFGTHPLTRSTMASMGLAG